MTGKVPVPLRQMDGSFGTEPQSELGWSLRLWPLFGLLQVKSQKLLENVLIWVDHLLLLLLHANLMQKMASSL